jgi:hypothetical protein
LASFNTHAHIELCVYVCVRLLLSDFASSSFLFICSDANLFLFLYVRSAAVTTTTTISD